MEQEKRSPDDLQAIEMQDLSSAVRSHLLRKNSKSSVNSYHSSQHALSNLEEDLEENEDKIEDKGRTKKKRISVVSNLIIDCAADSDSSSGPDSPSYLARKLRNKTKYKDLSWTIFPDDTPKMCWDLVIILVILMTAILVPYKLAFNTGEDNNEQVVSIIIDLLFSIDIILCFFTAYYQAGDKLITDKKKIACNYMTGSFIIDLLAVIPFGLILSASNGEFNKLLRVLRIQRLTKLTRLVKLDRVMSNLKSHRKKNWAINMLYNILTMTPQLHRTIVCVFSIILFIHVFACIWYFQAALFPDQSWITPEMHKTADNYELYITSYYWVTQTVVTVGYGDIALNNSAERLISCFLMVVGVFFYSFMIGNFSTMIVNTDGRHSIYSKKLNTLTQLKLEYNIREATFIRIKNSLDDKTHLGAIELVEMLPNRQRLEVNHYMYQGLVEGIRFFQKQDHSKLIAIIGPLLVTHKIKEGQTIFIEGDYANDMFFVQKGEMHLVLKKYQDFQFANLEAGCHFGEADIFTNGDRVYTAMARGDCELLSLDRKHFEQLFLKEFKAIGRKFYRESQLKNQQTQVKMHEAIAYCLSYRPDKTFQVQDYSLELEDPVLLRKQTDKMEQLISKNLQSEESLYQNKHSAFVSGINQKLRKINRALCEIQKAAKGGQ